MRRWSPARRKANSAVEIAAMPLEATMAASVFSKAAMWADSAWWFGPLLHRVYLQKVLRQHQSLGEYTDAQNAGSMNMCAGSHATTLRLKQLPRDEA